MIDSTSGILIKTLENRKIEIYTRELEVELSRITGFLSPIEVNANCQTACPNYQQKWTCPPKCPSFSEYAKAFSMIRMYLFYTSPEQFDFIAKEERAISAYQFIKEELQDFLRNSEQSGQKMIAANSCEICQTCALSLGKDCYFPDRLRYNMVAFGFRIDQIMSELFQHHLLWAKKDEIPDYMSSVGAILIP